MAGIIDFSTYYPRNIIDNQFLEELGIESQASWIREKLGIEERRTVLPLEYIKETKNSDVLMAKRVAEFSNTDLAIASVRPLLKEIDEGDVDIILANSSTPDPGVDSLSIEVARKLFPGSGVNCIDLFTACPAFALHLDFLAKHKFTKRYAIGVLTSSFTTVTNYRDRTDSAIWGDGSVAYLYDSQEAVGELAIIDSGFSSDTSRALSVVVERGGYFHQDGRAVRDFSVRQTVRMIRALEQKFAIDWDKDIFIGHQANGTMLAQITKNRKIPDHSHWSNVKYYGNQGGAGAPASLAMNFTSLTQGQRVVVAVLGAGLSWGSAVLEKR